MGLLGWVMMSLAVWHYTIFVPDRFWGGIVGACLAALVGGVISGLLINLIATGSLDVPGIKATDIVIVLYCLPGALLGMAAAYWWGIRQEEQHAAAHASA